MAGWSPSNPKTNAWLAMEASFGNGFLERLEHRQQYELNGLRQFVLGRHELTLFGIGYYGFSDIPGLIPIDVPVPGDTIENRQLDRTHTVLVVPLPLFICGNHKKCLIEVSTNAQTSFWPLDYFDSS